MSSDPHAYQLMEICAAGTFGTVVVVRDLHRGRLVVFPVRTRSVDVTGVTDGSMQNVPMEPVVIRSVRRTRRGTRSRARSG